MAKPTSLIINNLRDTGTMNRGLSQIPGKVFHREGDISKYKYNNEPVPPDE